jgi:hypothetical protein
LIVSGVFGGSKENETKKINMEQCNEKDQKYLHKTPAACDPGTVLGRKIRIWCLFPPLVPPLFLVDIHRTV